jgi:multisubunit Na+/H+ antiporter MnhC subunit
MNASLVLVAIMAVMYACGIFMLLERSMTRVLIGFLLLGNATNILILIMAGTVGIAPFVAEGVQAEELHDPLPQALSLTAIVITFGLSAFLLALIYRSWHLGQVDEVVDDPEDVAVSERDVAVEDEESDPQFAADTDFETEAASTTHAAETSVRPNEPGVAKSGGTE